MARGPILLAVVATLAGCAREGPEDPAVAAPGAGIPVGAIGAVGASFDAPSATPSLGPAPKSKHGKPKAAPIEPIPPDPFESPPDDPSPAPSIVPEPTPTPKKKPKHSPSETTL